MKLKSHSSMKKRIKVTGGKKLMMQKSCRNHLLVNKSKRQKKLDMKGKLADESNLKKIHRLLPHI